MSKEEKIGTIFIFIFIITLLILCMVFSQIIPKSMTSLTVDTKYETKIITKNICYNGKCAEYELECEDGQLISIEPIDKNINFNWKIILQDPLKDDYCD